MYRTLFIDFAKDKKCFFCKSERSLKFCRTIQDLSTGDIYVSSQCCFKKNKAKFTNANDKIPDLTRGIIRENSRSKSSNTEFAKEQDSSREISDLEYLILRQEKLSDVYKMQYAGIQDIYESYKMKFSLTENESYRLNRFIDKTIQDYPEFAPRNLQKLYACIFWLEYAITNTSNSKTQEFLQSILNSYKKYWKISESQANHVYETFEWINKNISKNQEIPLVKFATK